MSNVLGIDPGPNVSGVVVVDLESWRVCYANGGMWTGEVMQIVRKRGSALHKDEARCPMFDRVVIETMSPRGMQLGRETFSTIFQTGCLYQIAADSELQPVTIERDEIKRALLGRSNVRGADAAIRQYLLDEVGPKGTKAEPGPTYGVSKHAWAALAAVRAAWQEGRL